MDPILRAQRRHAIEPPAFCSNSACRARSSCRSFRLFFFFVVSPLVYGLLLATTCDKQSICPSTFFACGGSTNSISHLITRPSCQGSSGIGTGHEARRPFAAGLSSVQLPPSTASCSPVPRGQESRTVLARKGRQVSNRRTAAGEPTTLYCASTVWEIHLPRPHVR